uniref:Uncharacterized protein n=1 Tax=Panagrellus redivivus TaxID=6233 RepID=A0A7E4VQX8_PANRE
METTISITLIFNWPYLPHRRKMYFRYCFIFLLFLPGSFRPISDKELNLTPKHNDFALPPINDETEDERRSFRQDLLNALDEDEPLPKKAKCDYVEAESAANNGFPTCYFDRKRTTEHETEERPAISEVSSGCSDRSTLISFRHLIDNNDELFTQHGADNEADLILARGAGEFEHDWNDENVVRQISKRFICTKHRDELSRQWKHTIRFSKCAMPKGLGIDHTKPAKEKLRALQHVDAKAILYITGTLLHEGIEICKHHQKYARHTVTSLDVKEMNRVIYPQPITGNLADSESLEADMELSKAQCLIGETPRTSRCQNINYAESPDRKKKKPELITPPRLRNKCVPMTGPYGNAAQCHFEELMQDLRIAPISLRKAWQKMSVRNQYRHINAFKKTIERIAVLVAGESDAPNLLRASNVFTETVSTGVWQNKAQNEILEEISIFYHAAESKTERRQALAFVADVIPIGINATNPRVKQADLESFVGFICSEVITTGLPFGNTKIKLSTNRVVEIPSAIRSFRAADIIRMYKEDMKNRELPVAMSDSTMHRILEACPAKTKTTLDAVDQFKANGIQAFAWMVTLIGSMLEMEHVFPSPRPCWMAMQPSNPIPTGFNATDGFESASDCTLQATAESWPDNAFDTAATSEPVSTSEPAFYSDTTPAVDCQMDTTTTTFDPAPARLHGKR